ncbi:hypothetical protein [Jiangella anatolica]|uniref:hypothetical protein n=1 Tax=Jiangella anatolica TaxID=2670374 RepID=UPI001F26A897|nr:hypothetical protein [Jiangella anatolica]
MDDGGTGDAQVDEAVRTLDALDGMPVHEHAAVVERVHQVLQDRLAGEPDLALEDEQDEPVDGPGTDVARVAPAEDSNAAAAGGADQRGSGDAAAGVADGPTAGGADQRGTADRPDRPTAGGFEGSAVARGYDRSAGAGDLGGRVVGGSERSAVAGELGGRLPGGSDGAAVAGDSDGRVPGGSGGEG